MKKILYIEDDPNHQFTMELLLADNYQLISALDGRNGINMAMEYKPDLIIVDILLHKSAIDGHEIIKTIKSEPELAGIPVIAITGHTGETEKAKCYEEGCDGFFTKPIDVNTFTNDISKLIRD